MLERTVVTRAEVSGVVMTALGAGVLSPAEVEAVGVGGAGTLVPDEHDVAAASATAISRRRLNGQVA